MIEKWLIQTQKEQNEAQSVSKNNPNCLSRPKTALSGPKHDQFCVDSPEMTAKSSRMDRKMLVLVHHGPKRAPNNYFGAENVCFGNFTKMNVSKSEKGKRLKS